MQEEWKDVVGFEQYFKISSFGRLFSKRSNKILKQNIRKDKRVTVATIIGGRGGKTKCFKIHRLVAEAFIPNPENKPQVNHKDGNPSNNFLDNLEWVSGSENIRHAIDTGLLKYKRGFENPRRILSEEVVKELKRICIKGDRKFGIKALARSVGVAHTCLLRSFHLVD